MDSKAYWAKREHEAQKKYIKQEQEYIKELNRYYDNAMDAAQKEIDSFYAKYAGKEGVTLSEAKRRVSKLDIEEYSRKAAKYVKNKDFSKQANEEIRLYNLTMKVNRLEMLKSMIGLEMVSSIDEMHKYFDEKLTQRTINEFNRQAGILGKSVGDPKGNAKSVVNASFHNANFSSRLWTQQAMLKSELSMLLQRGMIQGKSSRQLAPELRKMFGVKKYEAERLMRTELTRVRTAAQMQSFEENGFDRYMFINFASAPYTKNPVCEICKDIGNRCEEEKGFLVKDMMPGENAPPMHPGCRCSVSAYMDREEFDKWLDEKPPEPLKNEGESGIIKQGKASYKNITDGQIEGWQKQSDSILSGDKNMKSAITDYTGEGYRKINRFLAGRISDYNKDSGGVIDIINSAIDKFKLKDDIIVYRGVERKHYSGLKVGDTFDSNIFFSASCDKSIAEDFAINREDGVMLNIRVPKGTPGMYIGSNSDAGNELEFLLSNKIKYKTKKITKNEITIEVEEWKR